MRSRRVAITASCLLVSLCVTVGCAYAQVRASRSAGRCERPSIFVDKSDGVLELRCGATTRARFEATFGANPVGPKRREGDERTPEGRYRVNVRVSTARFHRFLGVSYPNSDDLRASRALGVARPGGGIGIHGVTRSRSALARAWIHVAHDLGLQSTWGPTDGCIALANEDIEYLYDRAPVGTPIEIVP